jgi:hypothetical protein
MHLCEHKDLMPALPLQLVLYFTCGWQRAFSHALGFSIPPIVTWAGNFAQMKNISAEKRNNLVVFIDFI